MSAMPWNELNRSQQRMLIQLFGGGSLRNHNAADVDGLRRLGFIDDELHLYAWVAGVDARHARATSGGPVARGNEFVTHHPNPSDMPAGALAGHQVKLPVSRCNASCHTPT
jgi:hypothetical protein